mgnify:CR=1 FL=1
MDYKKLEETYVAASSGLQMADFGYMSLKALRMIAGELGGDPTLPNHISEILRLNANTHEDRIVIVDKNGLRLA